jgi:hypothetical protein
VVDGSPRSWQQATESWQQAAESEPSRCSRSVDVGAKRRVESGVRRRAGAGIHALDVRILVLVPAFVRRQEFSESVAPRSEGSRGHADSPGRGLRGERAALCGCALIRAVYAEERSGVRMERSCKI